MPDQRPWFKSSPALGLTPDDRGFLSWTFDPILAGTNTAAASGVVTGSRLRHAGGIITRVHCCTVNQLISGNAGQNFIGIYDTAGNLLAQTPDLTAIAAGWTTVGLVTATLAAPIFLPAGTYDVAQLWNNTAGANPQIARINNGTTGVANAFLNGKGLRNWTADTARTTLPAVLGVKVERPSPDWWGLS